MGVFDKVYVSRYLLISLSQLSELKKSRGKCCYLAGCYFDCHCSTVLSTFEQLFLFAMLHNSLLLRESVKLFSLFRNGSLQIGHRFPCFSKYRR